MKDYIAENERILDEWYTKFVEDRKDDPAYKGYNLVELFAKDGIMNKGEFESKPDKFGVWWRNQSENGTIENTLWANAPLRVLFLSKDENLYDYSIPAWDVRRETFYAKDSELKENKFSDSFFYQNEACLLYSLLHTTPEKLVSTEYTWEEALKFSNEQIFARINCKKEGGGGSCPNSLLLKAIENDGIYLKEQILNLDADIFICCGYSVSIKDTGNHMLNYLNTIGYHFEYIGEECGEDIYYDKQHNKIAINAYHLSYLKYDFTGSIIAYHEFLKKHPDFIESHRK